MGTDESVFNKIFTMASPKELTMIAKHYHKLTGKTILQAIDKEFSGDMKKLLKSIVYAIISPSEYFATRVNKAVKGWAQMIICLSECLWLEMKLICRK